MYHTTFSIGENIYLRPYQKDTDLDLVYYGKNDPLLREILFHFEPMTIEQVAKELDTWANDPKTKLFTICEKNTNKPIGQTAFVRVDLISRATVFYIAIYDSEYWSKGYGTEATKLMLQYAFDVLNLNRVQLHAHVDNEKAVKAYLKCGFQIEGTLREAMYHNNKYCDFYVMGILRKEYYELYK
ncbi:MAG TPA: GNAT family protein [Ignavibacteriales bacterium]|nr:GNAT family protein [Ignavibacteriales bacterium]HOL81017.1 GNAT family protein [Ignavibacteriales bacterium]HOM64753.1 GNAT family protein [Ignavibacteriales bacterium]HPD66715.1 GNAT family protein [Ignavibacteriales bacterium]HPP32797.1 GNAT family protein [Ignavibacteriales bacterium]